MDKLEIKASFDVTDEGEIVVNAWPFGSADSVGDFIVKGAVNIVGDNLPILFSHDRTDLIGTWSEITQTNEGLIMKGKLHVERPRVRSILTMVKSQLISGISIGFVAKAFTKRARGRLLTDIDLHEASIVHRPSHPKARIISAKTQSEITAAAVAEIFKRATAALRKDYK